MPAFIKHFVRAGPGRWICVRAGEYHCAEGRIQVTVGTTVTHGTTHMGVDLAAILEREGRMQRGNVIQFRPQQRGI
jgi:hypothetical protein